MAPADLAAAAREALRTGDPLLIAAADAPRLGAEHAEMALDDLRAGVDASLGPGMDGGWYLVGLARPHEALLDLLAEAVDGPEVMRRALALSEDAGLEVGLLRMERLLRSPLDAAALRADPCTPARIRTTLSRLG